MPKSKTRVCIQYLKQKQRPSPAEVKTLDHNTKQLLYEWKKLKLSEDGTLRRISGQFNEVVLPLSLRNIVYSELHRNMGPRESCSACPLLATHAEGYHKLYYA
eukprot:Seg3214.1 transcript_id=Seg3214.1/GoldUCD/mRNA.D3Y31 product="hypothetical protein" protein_id=Seg3214.1/GoldUCD/D3Y31